MLVKVKKRSKKVLWLSVGAVVVALLICAFFFRVQPPHGFLRGEKRWRTTVVSNPAVHPDSAGILYVSDLSVREVAEKARRELAPKGWDCRDHQFVAPGGWDIELINIVPGDSWTQEKWLHGQSVIMISRPPTANDRFNAWLDRLLRR